MSLLDWPVVADIVEAGSRDPIFDALLFAGPLLIVLIALLDWQVGETVFTRLLAAGYVAAFLGGIGYRAVSSRLRDQ